MEKGMTEHESYDPFDGLGEAYGILYGYVADDLHNVEDKTGSAMHELINEAKDKIINLEEIAEEDAEKLAAWLKRDLDEVMNYVSESEYSLKDWLGFETSLIKNAMIHTLLETTDKATLALLRMKKNTHKPYDYHTGEVAGFGTLICDECGEKLHFHKAGKIPPCPRCHETSFHRIQVD
jgi:hypothetical protein